VINRKSSQRAATKNAGRAARKHRLPNPSSQSIDLGHLPGLVGYALRQAQLAVFRDFLRSFSRFDIRPVQYGILTVIERNPGLKQQHVCHAIGIRRANFVALLDDLEHRGLARRGPSPHDQRASALYLTEKGVELMRELRRANKAHERRIAAGLGEERRKLLIQLLNTIKTSADDAP
jgi:DNA-binding MarR family transcriptional regulator